MIDGEHRPEAAGEAARDNRSVGAHRCSCATGRREARLDRHAGGELARRRVVELDLGEIRQAASIALGEGVVRREGGLRRQPSHAAVEDPGVAVCDDSSGGALARGDQSGSGTYTRA